MTAGIQTALFERDAELERIAELLDSARAGRGAVAVIEGPPGIGKSELLASARAHVSDGDFAIHVARCGVLEREHPFGAAHQLTGPSRRSRRTKTDAAASAGELLFEQLDQMYRALAMLADREPLLMSVDDAHWADAESLRLFAYLTARIESLPAVLLLSARPGEPGEDRELLAAIAAGGEVLRLRPLSGDGVARMISAHMSGSPDREFVGACLELSGGNPFLLAELVRAARAESIEPTAASCRRVQALTPAGVAHAVLVRLAQLPASATRLAGALAVLGGSSRLRDAAALADLSVDDASLAADALEVAEVIKAAALLEFVHPLVRKAVYDDLPPSERRVGHLRAAHMLDELSGRDPDRVAAHLLAVDPSDDAWTASRLIEAGELALARGGCDAATAYLLRALQEPPPEQQRAAVLVSLAQAEAAVGAPAAVAHLEAALALIDEPPERARVGQSLGTLFYLRGEYLLAGQTAKRALAELPDESGELARQLLADYLSAAALAPSLHAAPDAPGQALLGEVLAGSLPPEPRLCAHVAAAMAVLGQPHAGVREAALGANTTRLAEEDRLSQGLASFHAAFALMAIGDYELAEKALERAVRRARARGMTLGAALLDQSLAELRWRQGRLAAAAAHARAALQLRHAGWSFLVALAGTTLAFAELDRGDLGASRQALQLAETELSEQRPEFLLMLTARGRLAQAEGDPERSLHDLQLAGQLVDEMYGIESPEIICWRPFAAQAARANGERELAHELAQTGVERARANGGVRAQGIALRVAGEIAGSDGIDLVGEAVALLEPSVARLEHARALLALGSMHRRARRPREARRPLAAALELARACGAVPIAEHAYEELLASGARPRKMLRGGRDALTPAERRVAAMASEGLTNRQIAGELVLSTRTVEAHLAHVYTKLGVSSRRSLGEALAEGDDATRSAAAP